MKTIQQDMTALSSEILRGKHAKLMLVTPNLASAMLGRNEDNRPLTPSQVDRFVRYIEEDRFLLLPDAIAFDVNGRLRNGQHRLSAITITGISQEMLVVFGLPVDAFLAMDRGKKRSAGDDLSIKHRTQGILRAAAAKCIMQLGGQSGSDPQDVVIFEEDLNQDILSDGISAAIRLNARAAGGQPVCSFPASMAAAYYHIRTNTDSPGKVNEFFATVASGEGISGPRLKLRDWLMGRAGADAIAPYGKNYQRISKVVETWNLFLSGGKRWTVDAPEVIPSVR